MTATVEEDRTAVGADRLPGAWGLGLRRGRLEITQFLPVSTRGVR